MLTALLCVLLASPTVAPPSQVLVVSIDDTPPPAGFLDALRIQLAGSARVAVGGRLAGATTGARIEEAGRLAVEPVALVAWVERSGDDQVLYAVGRRSSGALVDAFRQPATGGPDADRALALKVHEVLDQVLLARPPEPAPPAAAVTAEPELAPLAKPPRVARLGADMELIARGVSGGPGEQIGGGMALSGGVRIGPTSADLYALAYLASGLSASMAGSDVDTRELGAGGGLRAVTAVGPLSAGGALELSGRRVHANATTDGGERGSRALWVAVVSPLAELRYPIAAGITLRAAAGLDVALTRQRFSVNGATVLDLGRTRARVDLSLMLRLR